jgi:hypothetical protein
MAIGSFDLGLADLRSVVPQASVVVPTVSKWSAGMHVQHVCLAMIGVCQFLVASEPPPPPSGFSLVTSAIFLTGRIPRGRGKSPDQAIPSEGVSRQELETLLAESERRIEEARQVSADHWFRHFAFGVLDRDRTLKFIGIHNRHHLRIVRDILQRKTAT